jgi:hypothetical protein
VPEISITDGLNAAIVSANPHLSTGLGKYFRGTSGALLAGADVAGQLRTPLLLANPGESGLALAWKGDVGLGDGSALTIEAGARAVVGVLNRAGMDVFDTTFIGRPLKVPSGTALVSFSIRPSLALGLKRQAGALSFGFTAGAEAEIVSFHPFSLTDGTSLTVADACRTVLEHFVVPNRADDLRQMKALPANALACVSGHGELQIGASLNVAAAFNPLASVEALSKVGSLEVAGPASATVGVKAKLSGDFQIRVQKMEGAKVRLGYHKVAGRELEVSLTGSAGLGVSIGDREVLEMLFDGPGGIPGAAKEDLVQGGITSAQLERVAAAMQAGLSRRVELALAASIASAAIDEAAFLYEIDLDALDKAGAEAIDQALAGDLTLLNALEGDAAAHGIETIQSRTQALRKKKVSFRVNLVGIVNVLSMKELVKTATVTHDADSGEVVIVDKATSDRVGAITTGKHIRKLLYESTMMSLTYRAIGLDVTTALAINQSFFFFDRSANRQRVSDYLDAVEALALVDAATARQLLGGQDDFGKASLLLETRFDNAASQRIFELPAGVDPPAFYERIGREALLALIKPDEADAYRRLPLGNEKLWAAMKDAGQPNFRHILPPPITGGSDSDLRVRVVEADYTLITWWAKAMAKAAEQLDAMRAFLKGREPQALGKDAVFVSRRADLAKAIAKAVGSNKSSFDDPWGVVVLHRAARGAAAAEATLIGPRFSLFLPA